MSKPVVMQEIELGFPWQTFDPFLFCVHHDDDYPAGNERMGPDPALLRGRNIGQDFQVRDGWRMYHGDVVPGFPRHPHRGFETVTLARRGFIDHSDSMGAKARFGHGDAQWMTAGGGVVHSEMFPLVKRAEKNRTELFQLWLNLPAKHKMVEPHFKMLWNERIPKLSVSDDAGGKTELALVAGRYGEAMAPAPPPKSWAHDPANEVAIWTIKMAPRARFTLPAASPGLSRTLYFFRGSAVAVGGHAVMEHRGLRLRSELDAHLENHDEEAELLLLQGRPIGEPVIHHGPFVMNTPQEIRQAIADYQRTGYGGWPWSSNGPVHPREADRFAVHADGRKEDAPTS